jgi:hypothetical protein
VVEKLFPIELTRSEKDLLLNDLDLDSIVSGKIRLLAQRGNTIVVKLERGSGGGRPRSRAGEGVPRSLREAGARRTTGLRPGRAMVAPEGFEVMDATELHRVALVRHGAVLQGGMDGAFVVTDLLFILTALETTL